DSHQNDVELLSLFGSATESIRDIDELNLAPPEELLFRQVISKLHKALKSDRGEFEEDILIGLSTATRMMSRQYDELSEFCYKRLVELSPSNPAYHYGLGLYCKTRGLFEEGLRANETGLKLLDEPRQAYLWNLGICATGAGEGEKALKIWKNIGNKIEMGAFDLPEGRYPSCKVKLAEFPLAERNQNNDHSGLQETIWIERLSPCHGIIRSVLYHNLGVDYGDVILIDGAPITYHKYGDQKIPVFPHLATLLKRQYAFYDFAAIQQEKGQISEISESLEQDSVIYVHTENFRILCNTCWLDPDNNHEQHEEAKKNIVTGRIASPNTISAKELLSQIDKAIGLLANCKIYSPQLVQLAGYEKRAEIERKRYSLIVDN
ncbi:tetratricopeptide repeat protein, partial [Paraglaciecola hydrolytica]